MNLQMQFNFLRYKLRAKVAIRHKKAGLDLDYVIPNDYTPENTNQVMIGKVSYANTFHGVCADYTIRTWKQYRR